MPQLFRSPERLAPIAVSAVFLVLAIWATASLKSTFDTARYANVGHWIGEGRGITSSLTVLPVQEGTRDQGEGLASFTIQPPGLPFYYAAVGVDHRHGAHRFMHVLSLLVLGLATWSVARQLGVGPWVSALPAAFTVASPAVIEATRHMWTDLPFVALQMAALALVIRANRPGRRPLFWLGGGALALGLATTLRLPGLGFGLLLVLDAVIAWRLGSLRDGFQRLAVSLGVFAIVTVPVLVRNMILVGSPGGTAPQEFALKAGFDLLRGWSFLGARLVEALLPGFAYEPFALKAAAAGNTPDGWALPGLVIAAIVVGFIFLAWKRGKNIFGPGLLLAAMAVGYLIVVLVPAARHLEYTVVELRYAVPLVPLIWILVASVASRWQANRGAAPVALVVTLVWLAGVTVLARPGQSDHGFVRDGMDWIAANIPAEDRILTNGGKVFMDEDLSRRVLHLSTYNYKHALGNEVRSEIGLGEWLAERDVRWVVLIGRPNRRMPLFWGDEITSLFTGRRWTDRLVYQDPGAILVYRVPETMPMYGGDRR